MFCPSSWSAAFQAKKSEAIKDKKRREREEAGNQKRQQ